MKIYLASDHAGFTLKESVKQYLLNNLENFPLVSPLQIEDMGTFSPESANWAEFAAKAAAGVSQNPKTSRGILICGSGIGMSMAANKFKNVRAALCHDTTSAEMSRKHNNANVLNLGARVIDNDTALLIVKTWLNTEFEGGRHQKRLDFLHETIEKENFKD